MAAIDKTYTAKWDEYQELKNWAFGKTFIAPDGSKFNMNAYIIDGWAKQDFNDMELPVMSTTCEADYFIIKYCPIKFVQDRMNVVYTKDYIKSILNGTSEYDTFTKEGKYGTRIKIIKYPDGIFGKHNRPYKQKSWWVQLDEPEEYEFLEYFEKENTWPWPYELSNTEGESASNCCIRYHTIKALRRAILKWKLPKGTVISATGRYVGDEYKFLVY